MKKSVLLTLVIISLIISGCKNLSLFQKAENSLADSVNVQDESGELTVLEYSKERTAVELIFNAELAAQGRYAMPSSLSGVIDSTDYSVYASVSSDRGVTYKQYKCDCTGSTMRFSNYAISTDTALTLKIRFIAVYGNTYNADNKVMQSNEISVTIPANTKIASYDKSVLLFPATSVAENVPGGKVCLKLSSSIASDSFRGFGTDGYTDQFDRNFVIVGDTLYHKTYADPDDPGLAPGSYTVQIGCFTSGSVRKSLITQTIIVYQGLTTDKWAETGSDTFSFAGLGVKEFYVKSRNTSGYTGWPCTGVITGAGEGEGSMKFPYVNIASAIARISTLSDKTSEYTIYCEGVFSGLTDGLEIPDGYKIKIVGLGTKKSVIDLDGSTGKTIISVNGTDSRNGTSLTLENMELRNGKRGIAVTSSKLILKNCDIHDNDAGTDYGAGIVCLNGSDVYIMDNVTIHHNKAKYGAGISFGNESYVNIVINCVINGENTKIYANKAATHGGGVYIKDNNTVTASKFILKKGSIFANCADSCGGGIYISGGGNTKADVTIEGGKIAGNKAERGGGIYCNTYANFKLKGGVIGGTSPAVDLDLDTVSQTQLLTYENKGNYVTLRGGGIYASGSEYSSGCEIELSGGNVISNGPDAAEGAGVYGLDRTFNISGGFSVAASNSFYIAAATKLTITGDLTPPQSYTTIARIEYVNAAIGRQVLYGDSTLILNNYTKFLSYVQNSSSEYFKIDSTGKLIPYD